MSNNNEMFSKKDVFQRLSDEIDFMEEDEEKEIIELLKSMTKEDLEIVKRDTFYI